MTYRQHLSRPGRASGPGARRFPAALLLVLGASFAMAGEAQVRDFRVAELEREVRELRQHNRDLSQRLARVERELGVERRGTVPGIVPGTRADDPSLWMQPDLWQQIELGDSEMDVIDVLGPPTSYRDADSELRILFYALEIGASGFLAGQVELQQDRVVHVEAPRLR